MEAIEDKSLAVEPWGHSVPNFTPLDDLCLIRRDPKPKQVGKVLLSAVHVKPNWWGVVVKTGPGHRVGAVDKKHPADRHHCRACRENGGIIPMLVRAGDHVCVVHGTGQPVDGDDTLLVVAETQIILVERE